MPKEEKWLGHQVDMLARAGWKDTVDEKWRTQGLYQKRDMLGGNVVSSLLSTGSTATPRLLIRKLARYGMEWRIAYCCIITRVEMDVTALSFL